MVGKVRMEGLLWFVKNPTLKGKGRLVRRRSQDTSHCGTGVANSVSRTEANLQLAFDSMKF